MFGLGGTTNLKYPFALVIILMRTIAKATIHVIPNSPCKKSINCLALRPDLPL